MPVRSLSSRGILGSRLREECTDSGSSLGSKIGFDRDDRK